jgi:hypothetical protein
MFRDTFPYFTLSRIDRSYAKPRGHAGDYLTIEMLYNNQAGGDRRLGPYIDRWALDLPASHAVKNRRRLLTDVIMGVAAENPGPWYGALERLVTPRSVTRSKRRPGETPLGVHPVVTSTKAMTGHLLGAAGAVEAIATVLVIREHNVALVFTAA